jgi:hypothetical protein
MNATKGSATAAAPVQETAAHPGDPRFTWGLIIDVLDVLERHGYRKGDDQHTGRAIGMLLRLAATYEGTGQDACRFCRSPLSEDGECPAACDGCPPEAGTS